MDAKSYVGKYYQMDPETEDLVRGKDLKNGMRVLVENHEFRVDLGSLTSTTDKRSLEEFIVMLDSSNRNAANTWNRWFTVSEVSQTRHTTEFVAVYDDGTKKTCDRSSGMGWYVKKDSIPAKTDDTRFSDFLNWALVDNDHDGISIEFYQNGRKVRTYQAGTAFSKPQCKGPDCTVDRTKTGLLTIHRGGCKLNNTDPHPTRTDIPVYVPEKDAIETPGVMWGGTPKLPLDPMYNSETGETLLGEPLDPEEQIKYDERQAERARKLILGEND